jgi:hypothetical protein
MAAAETSAPAASRPRFIADIAVTHSEELAYLWERRCSSVTSRTLTSRDIAKLNERIEAHTQGLLVTAASLIDFAHPLLSSADRGEAFAGAYPLLRSGNASWAPEVVAAFEAAKGEGIAGLRDAMCLAGIDRTGEQLSSIVERGDPAHAVAAAAVLAVNKRLDPASTRLSALIADPEPAVAEFAWRVAWRVDDVKSAVERPFADAIRGKHAGICDAALGLAIWRAEPWAGKVTRALAEEGNRIGLQWLAATGEADAVAVLVRAIEESSVGPERLALAGRFGHPVMIERLLAQMDPEDPALAAAAGDAFERITGIEIRGVRRPLPVPDDAGEFEREFAGEVWVPDAAKAQQLWQRHGESWRAGQRWCRGCEVSSSLKREAQSKIDMEGFWDFGARAALAGSRAFGPPSTF